MHNVFKSLDYKIPIDSMITIQLLEDIATI